MSTTTEDLRQTLDRMQKLLEQSQARRAAVRQAAPGKRAESGSGAAAPAWARPQTALFLAAGALTACAIALFGLISGSLKGFQWGAVSALAFQGLLALIFALKARGAGGGGGSVATGGQPLEEEVRELQAVAKSLYKALEEPQVQSSEDI